MGSLSRPSVSNETSAATYDRFATLYDWFVSPWEARTRRRALDLLSIEPDEQILELGCGPEHGVVSLAPHVNQTVVWTRYFGPEDADFGLPGSAEDSGISISAD